MAYDFGNKDLGQIYAAIVALGTNTQVNNQTLVKITTITPEVLNDLADDDDSFVITVENAIPEGQYLAKAFSHTKVALVSDTEIELVINKITAKALADNQKPVNDAGVIQEFDPTTAIGSTTNNVNVTNDVEITITMSDTNLQDWITGEIEIYLVLIDFPDPEDLS